MRKQGKRHIVSLTRFILAFITVVSACGLRVSAQEFKHLNVPEDIEDYTEIYRDTLEYIAPTMITVQKDSILEPMRVVTNKFGKNWFLFATAGVHSFRGDYSNLGPWKGTLSPDFGVGIGKWFTPGIGLKVEFIRSNSRGYTGYETGDYGYGPILDGKHGPYRKMKTGWWDVSASAILNLSRLFLGYEGIGNRKLMNQFMLNVGVGMVHHMFDRENYGSDNEWSGHLEFQYSRFFTPAKRWSLDIKLRGLFYQTNFDLEYGQRNHAANKVDFNYGIDVGFTLYLGKKRDNGWGHSTTKLYQRDYRARDVLVIKEREVAECGPIEQGTMTFYVFYPNNYSGRNDAPVIADANVHSMDYLAGGLYTQKKYADTEAAKARLQQGISLNGLATEDIPTELAEHLTFATDLPRGYEMLTTEPLSLSLKPGDMQEFEEKEGFVYAPIYDGKHTWQYRIDDATQGQILISDANYAETQSFGINAHSGLPILHKYMHVDNGDELVSFADVYAAINGNEGYISQFTDEATVNRIKNILNNGVISVIQVEGMATSQDNNTGADRVNVGIERNTNLSNNRSESVVEWLKQNPNVRDALIQTYIGSGRNTINRVDDPSTRGLDAKLNRGAKVRIHYMLK